MIDLLFAQDSNLYTGHPMEFVPQTFAQLWRLALLVMSATLLGKIVFGLSYKHTFMANLPWERRIAWACVGVFTLRTVFVAIAGFDATPVWESLPVNTVAIALGLIAVRQVRGLVSERCVESSKLSPDGCP